MKKLLVLLTAIFIFNDAKAATVFPIATNPAVVNFGGGVGFDGTNYIVGFVSGANIVGQRVSGTNGSLLGSPISVGSNPGFPPAIAGAFNKTNYFVAWSDTSVGSGVDMFGQFISKSGATVGSKFNLLSSADAGSYGFQTVEAMASDGTNFLVVWQDQNTAYFYGQLVTPSGSLSGPEFLISSQSGNGNSAAVAFGKTNYLVVWQSNNGGGNANQTYGALVSRSGVLIGPGQIGQTASYDQNPLAVAFDGTNYLVAWNWDDASGNWDIYGRLVSQTGTSPGNELYLVTDPGSQVLPALAFDGANYLMAWGDGSFDLPNPTIRFQFFNRSGSASGSEFTVFTAQGTNNPLFTYNGLIFDGNRFVVAATLGTITTDGSGDVTGFPSGEVFGAFIPSSTALQVTTASLPDGVTTVPYSQTLTASGGQAPYTWSLISNSLPAGLNLSSSGVISGTPTTAVTTNFTVQVKDNTNSIATQSFPLTVMALDTGVSFVNTPATISNTYPGIVTLQISGLSNAETVVVQKYLVADGSNAVDASAFLVQQFKLTDGQANVFTDGTTSVTNFNVPGDTDGVANGSITANLYPSFDFEQEFVGTYQYVLSSPVGHFSPLTNSFTVTNFPFGQTITGNVVSNSTATTLPYSIVVVGQSGSGNDFNVVAGVVANKSGAYTVNLPTGTYRLIGFKTNYVTSFAAAPVVTLSGPGTVTTNVSLTLGTNFISGRLVDSTNSNLGLGGCSVDVQSTDHSLMALGATDTNGYFTTYVTGNQWKVSPDDKSLVWYGYYLPNKLQVDTTTGSVSGLVISVPRATAIFYGKVRDIFGNPLPGVAVYSEDNDNNYSEMDGFVFTNGEYVTAAIGGLSNDPWQLSEDYGGPANYIYTQSSFQQNGGTNLNIGQAVKQNFTGILATNYITGNVQFNGTNVPGVGVSANATIDGVNFNSFMDTDSNGNYSLNVANTNSWSVSVNCNGGNDSLDNLLGSGNYQCPSGQNVGITNDNQTVNFIIQPANSSSYQIFGSVTNNEGAPVAGVNVYANDGMGDTYTNSTDSNGDYEINVPNGNYTVTADCTQLGNDGYGCPGEKNADVSGNSVGVDFTVQTCQALSVTTSELPNGELSNAYYYNDSSGFQLQNDGCNAPFTWSLSPGLLSLPAGLNLSSGGLIYGTPTVAGTNYFSVRVTDADNNTSDQLLSITDYPALVITNTTLSNATINVSYNVQLNTSGGMGTGAFGYYIYSGSLPPGLEITLGGLITGTPTATGTYPFTVSVQDNAGYASQKSFSITVQGQSLTITTSTLTNATVGGAYTNQLQATGGTTPYTWTIAQGSQQPPAGLTLSTNGIIGGIPATNGTFSFIVRVTDVNSLTTTHSFTLVVNSKPVLHQLSWLTNQFSFWIVGVTDQNYTVQMSTNLVSGNWNTILITNNGVTNSFRVTDPNATNKEGLYRLLLGP